jgi:hypothetical protein
VLKYLSTIFRTSLLNINVYMISSLAQPTLLCLITNFHTSICISNQARCSLCQGKVTVAIYRIITGHITSKHTRQGNDTHVMRAGCTFLFLYLCILIVMYVLFCIFCFHHANWHSLITLTEVFLCFFLSCMANAKV